MAAGEGHGTPVDETDPAHLRAVAAGIEEEVRRTLAETSPTADEERRRHREIDALEIQTLAHLRELGPGAFAGGGGPARPGPFGPAADISPFIQRLRENDRTLDENNQQLRALTDRLRQTAERLRAAADALDAGEHVDPAEIHRLLTSVA